MGDPEILDTHPQSEQPQPSKLCVSIHISLRLISSPARHAIWYGFALVKDGVALVISGSAAMAKATFAPGDVPRESPFFDSKLIPNGMHKASH